MLSFSNTIVLLLTTSAILTLFAIYFVWQERPKAGAGALAITDAGVLFWASGQILVFTTGSLSLNQLGMTVSYLGMSITISAWLVFALQYTGQSERVTRGMVAFLVIQPLLVIGLGMTNHIHELFWQDMTVSSSEAGALTYQFGSLTWVHVGYCYVITLTADWILFKKFMASRNVYRTRTFLFLFMSATTILTSGISFAQLSPFGHFALTPIYFLSIALLALILVSSNWFVSSLPIGRFLAVFRSRSKNLAPVARNTAIEELDTGFLVLDHQNRIVDVNPMSRLILGRADERIIGQTLDKILPEGIFLNGDPAFFDATATGEYPGVWVELANDERRCFDVVVNPITAGGDLVGRVALIHDVTGRERRKQQLETRTQELERQNEQLEEFAGVVSHDLRNPLNVAKGRLSLVDVKGDDAESVKIAIESLDRMEDIIEDVLALARSGQTIAETSAVDLPEAVQLAWENVETDEATLEVETETVIDADKTRLARLLENLFRNAIEHSDDDHVTVTVGDLESGFYVADDGPGIPPDHREQVFEQGFTSSRSGTGFGLSIVETIAEAHSWDVTVTESKSGGARFEITGVQRQSEPAVPVQ